MSGDDAFDALPSSVVVHGRQGRNSNINGVYIRDWSTSTSQPCFRRPDYAGGQAIFLYFEGEWRLGRSPEHGCWAKELKELKELKDLKDLKELKE